MRDIASLDASYPQKKIVIALASTNVATAILKAQGGHVAEGLGDAYAWWMKYATAMDEMYLGMDMQRSVSLPNWHCRDQSVLKEFTDLGGVGIPVL